MGMQVAHPHAATKDEIKLVIQGFAHAAEFLHKAGYDGVERHGAHGYRLVQSFSQTPNKRRDEYGGKVTKRSRLVLGTHIPPGEGLLHAQAS